jgi:cytochrome c oxidase subunit II
MRRFVTAAILLCAAAGAVVAQGGTGEKKTFEVTTKSFEFVPNKIEVNQGDTVVITTKSADRTHGFAIKKFNVKQSVPKGGTPVTVEFVAAEAGTFDITCSEYCGSGHKGMKGTLVVLTRGTR